MSSNQQLFERACRVIPGGVNSPVRSFAAVGGHPYFVERALGATLWDVEGNAYTDLVQSYGAIIAGHAHPKIVEAVAKAASAGTSFGAPTRGEVLLAEAMRERVPSCEKTRLVSSGTEATMTAIRLARGVTGRSKVLKFAGNYHGHGDSLLAQSGSGVAHLDATTSVPGSAGVTPAAVAETVVAAYNTVPVLDSDVACVIVEPVAANMGLVAPSPGFLAGLRAECDRVGALLVFDEVITGFRLGRGGAQELFGVTPDLSTFGKVIGGGLNIGAFGGRAEIMDEMAPLGPVYQAGTLSGNPLATAAGLAALDLLDHGAYEQLAATAAHLADGLTEVFARAKIQAQVPRVGTLVGLFFTQELPTDYSSAQGTDRQLYAKFFRAMLQRGIALAPGPFEIMFVGLAHEPASIDAVLEAARDTVANLDLDGPDPSENS